MRTVSYCFATFLVTSNPKDFMIHSLKFLAFKFLGIDFLTFSSSHCHKHQPVLGLGVRDMKVP